MAGDVLLGVEVNWTLGFGQVSGCGAKAWAQNQTNKLPFAGSSLDAVVARLVIRAIAGAIDDGLSLHGQSGDLAQAQTTSTATATSTCVSRQQRE